MATDLDIVDEFTEPVTVPEPGDDRTSASVRGAFQALTNRTWNLLGRITDFIHKPHTWTANQTFDTHAVLRVDSELDMNGTISLAGDLMVGPNGDVKYADENGASVPRLRTVLAPGGTAGAAGSDSGMFGWTFSGAGTLEVPLRLPHGATLQQVTAGFRNAAGAPALAGLTVYRRTPNKANPGAGGAGVEIGTKDATAPVGSNSSAHRSVTAINEVIDNASSVYYASAYIGDVGAIAYVEITYLDPGPRNH